MNTPKLALWGMIIGLFVFFTGPIFAGPVWLWVFAAFYAGFPLAGLLYDLRQSA